MLKKYDDVTGNEIDLGAGFEIVCKTVDGAVFVRHVANWYDIFSAEVAQSLTEFTGRVEMVQVRDVALAAAEQRPQSERQAPSSGPASPGVRRAYPHVDADGLRTS